MSRRRSLIVASNQQTNACHPQPLSRNNDPGDRTTQQHCEGTGRSSFDVELLGCCIRSWGVLKYLGLTKLQQESYYGQCETREGRDIATALHTLSVLPLFHLSSPDRPSLPDLHQHSDILSEAIMVSQPSTFSSQSFPPKAQTVSVPISAQSAPADTSWSFPVQARAIFTFTRTLGFTANTSQTTDTSGVWLWPCSTKSCPVLYRRYRYFAAR